MLSSCPPGQHMTNQVLQEPFMKSGVEAEKLQEPSAQWPPSTTTGHHSVRKSFFLFVETMRRGSVCCCNMRLLNVVFMNIFNFIKLCANIKLLLYLDSYDWELSSCQSMCGLRKTRGNWSEWRGAAQTPPTYRTGMKCPVYWWVYDSYTSSAIKRYLNIRQRNRSSKWK